MPKYEVGSKVLIVTERTHSMNMAGEMDCYLGTVMTIAEIRTHCNMIESSADYKMEEDNGEWHWYDHDIVGLADGTTVTTIPEHQNELDQWVVPELAPEVFSRICEDVARCLDHYQWTWTEDGVAAIVKEWWDKKSWIISKFATLDEWNADKFMLTFDYDFDRKVDTNVVRTFHSWFRRWIDNHVYVKANHAFSISDYMKMHSQYNTIYRTLRDMKNHCMYGSCMGFTTSESDMEEVKALRDKYSDIYYNYSEYTQESVNKANTLRAMIDQIRSSIDREHDGVEEFIGHINEADAKQLNELASEIDMKLRAQAGQKISRVVRKIAQLSGLFDMSAGSEWERRYAKFTDAITPLKIKRHTLLSFHPVDYLRMSMGHSWTSCQTIDRANVDGRAGDHYNGMHANGTMSYLLDSCTGVFYTVDSEYDGTDFEWQDKLIRQLYHFGEKFFVQGRLYPQSNDSGANDLYKECRQIVQKLYADAFGIPNMWQKPIDADSNCRFYRSQGTHYADYKWFSQCKISRHSQLDHIFPIVIGAKPICTECGKRREMCDEELSCCHHFSDEYCDELVEDDF